jgi:hypothetical protein
MVWATFDNGDGVVDFHEVGNGVYRGTWTPRGDPSTGNCVITIYAKGAGVQGKTTRTVKIIESTKLKVEILKPPESFDVSAGDAVVVSARVTRTDDQGRDYGSPDSSHTSVTARFTNDGPITLSATDGLYTGTWIPKNPGDCTIEVKAVDNKGVLKPDSDTVSGTVGGLSRVEIDQIPKHVVKDVSARFTVCAYDSSNQIIPISDLTYECYIDSTDNQVATSTQTLDYTFIQTLDYTFETLGSHRVYCKVTYGTEDKFGKLDVNVEPFTIEFKPPTKFSPMAGESAVVEFKVNTLAKVCVDDVVIPKAYYPTWLCNDKVDIDKEVTVVDPDQWYGVTIWDGRINNGQPAINGLYTVELRAKPLSWFFSEDKNCKILVYDDPGKFVSIERQHLPRVPSGFHKSGKVTGYAKWAGGESGGWVFEPISHTVGLIGAYLASSMAPWKGYLAGYALAKAVEKAILPIEYTVIYDYKLERIRWFSYVIDRGKKYGPFIKMIPSCYREDLTRTVTFEGTWKTEEEKAEFVGCPWLAEGLYQYIDPKSIVEKKDPLYKSSSGTWRDISNAQLYDKNTPQGKKYREKLLKIFKRLSPKNLPVANGMQHLEIMRAPSLGYSSETTPDFSRLSILSASHASAQSYPAKFSDAFSDYGIGTDENELYDTLTVLAGVDVSVAGNYIVEAGLFDDSGAPIVWSGNYSLLEPGTHNVALQFNGIMINRHGVAGPYNLKYIRLYDENLTQIDNMADAYHTSAYDNADFQVPPANFTGTFSDHGTDTDSDELFNYLTVSVGVDVLSAGNYAIIGSLLDDIGEPVTWTNITSSLDTGGHTLYLDFDGIALRQHGVAGPYNLSLTLMSNGILVDSLVDAYTTSSYNQNDFQPASAQFNGVFSDYGRDIDGDGLYRYLTVSAGVDVFDTGNYTVTGNLYDRNGELITWASNTTFLDTGSKTLYLEFDGVGIREHLVDGPYDVSILLVKKENPEEDLSYSSHTTSAFSYVDFQAPPEEFEGVFSDYGRDADGDGLYNYLTISAGVAVSNAGNYSIVGNLYDRNGRLITWATNYTDLNVGSQSVVLHFDGFAIGSHAVDGPYDVSLALLMDENLEEVLYSSNYTTSAYSYTDFQVALAELSGFFSDRGTDTDSNGFYDYLTVDVGINVIATENYSIEGRLDDANSNDIVHAYCSSALYTGTQTMQLNFDGCSIRKHGLNGPYNLSYVRLYNQNGIQIDCQYNAHTTSAYNYTQFEGYPVDLRLSLHELDIVFNPETPTDGETVIITATIHNAGTDDDVSLVVVQFFDGNPEAGGVQIGSDQTIPDIAHESTDTAQVTWTAIPGTHDIFVRVDPYDTIQEANENNNHAFRQITVSGVALPDYDVELTVEGANATTTSPAENATYTLTVKNTGTKTDSYSYDHQSCRECHLHPNGKEYRN